MFAAGDSLLYVVIFMVIAGISNWLQSRKRQKEQDAPPPDPGPHAPRQTPPVQATSWEEELKKLLEGATETSTPPQHAPLPPPILAPTPLRTPPPLQRPAPVSQEVADDAQLVPIQTYGVERAGDRVDHALGEKVFETLPGLSESTVAYDRASNLDSKVQLHMQQVTRRPVGTTQAQHKVVPPQVAQAVALVRNPQSLRAAITASFILGPPRSLAE